MTPEKVQALVHEYISRHDPGRSQLEIVDEGIREENDWWYVPVRLKEAGRPTYSYYGMLADIEGELDEETGMNVLLVPAV